MTGKAPIRTIAVAGGGVVGFSAALAFARSLPQARVQLVDLPVPANALADRLPGTLPSIRHFHRLAGIAEADAVRAAQSSYRLGTRFEDWPAGQPAWYHCFGRHGAQVANSAFHHQWMRLRSLGKARAFDCYAPAASLARAGKFVHPSDDQSSLLSSFDYALRIDPARYGQLLRTAAIQARVAVRQGVLADVVTGRGGTVEALRLEDGSEVRADLFIDCAGPGAPVLSRLSAAFEAWDEAMPFDRILLQPGAAAAPSPVDTARATDAGYEFSIPLLGSSLSGTVFNSAIDSEDSVRRAASAGDPAELIGFSPGRVRQSWVGNVVAFGDAACRIDPLESTNLSLAQSAIRRAAALIPDNDFHPLVLAEFNRRTAAEADRVRDFVAVHFLASTRREGAVWESMADRRLPDSLAHTLEQFTGRGRLPKFEEETFEDDSWLAVLFGLGLEPRRIDPTALRVDPIKSAEMLEHMAATSAALPGRLPAYDAYLAQLMRG